MMVIVMQVKDLQSGLRIACLKSGYKLCDEITEQAATGVWIEWHIGNPVYDW